MINPSELLIDLSVGEFVPVICASVGIFVLLVLLFIGICKLVAWCIDKYRMLEERARQRMINEIKCECVEDITRYYDDAYKRLEGDDNAEKRK